VIGLEYIRKQAGMSLADISEILGVSRQFISKWEKGEKKIPQKYLPVLADKFNTFEEYLQKELSDLDKIQIQKNNLRNHIDKTSFQDKEVVFDDVLNDWIEIEVTRYDEGAIENFRTTEIEEKELILKSKIHEVIHNINTFWMFETYLTEYATNVELFSKYTDILNSKKLEPTFIFEILRAIECIDKEIPCPENYSDMTKELYNVLFKHLDERKKKQEKFKQEMAKLVGNDNDELY
jgi:transcriptional regulator with XRE-family HTH domain